MATFYAGQTDYIDALNSLASQSSGSSTRTIVNITSTYSAPTTTNTLVILCNINTNVTINLPTAVGNTGTYIIKKISSTNTLTIDGYLSQTIDGTASTALTTLNTVVTLISDGSNWRVV